MELKGYVRVQLQLMTVVKVWLGQKPEMLYLQRSYIQFPNLQVNIHVSTKEEHDKFFFITLRADSYIMIYKPSSKKSTARMYIYVNFPFSSPECSQT